MCVDLSDSLSVNVNPTARLYNESLRYVFLLDLLIIYHSNESFIIDYDIAAFFKTADYRS